MAAYIREATGWPKIRDAFAAIGGRAVRIEAARTAGVPDIHWTLPTGGGGKDTIAGWIENKGFVRWDKADGALVLKAIRPGQRNWMNGYARAGGRVAVGAVVPWRIGAGLELKRLAIVSWGPEGVAPLAWLLELPQFALGMVEPVDAVGELRRSMNELPYSFLANGELPVDRANRPLRAVGPTLEGAQARAGGGGRLWRPVRFLKATNGGGRTGYGEGSPPFDDALAGVRGRRKEG